LAQNRDDIDRDSSTSDNDEIGSANFNEFALRSEFAGQQSRFDKLRSEVLSILQESINSSGIKIGAYENRTKQVESLLVKCRHKDYKTLSQLNDIVGLRIICLFRADISRLGEIIKKFFNVISVDDKVSSSVDEFGYMSVHYICQLPQAYAGPRYDDIKDIRFEIQVRTAAMHAWAAISHAIDYKNEADVPVDLRKSFNALSALFFLADTQFELFAREAALSRERAEKIISSPRDQANVDLDFDTLSAFMSRHFPGRKVAKSEAISNLLSELLEFGINNLGLLSQYFKPNSPLVDQYEKFQEKKGKFSQVGAVRMTLAAVSSRYRNQIRSSGRSVGQYWNMDAFKDALDVHDID
jgi:ppGpp synthetase/RelA/SpoT-type nucleotidyltranferase